MNDPEGGGLGDCLRGLKNDLDCEIDGEGIAWLSFNRPEKRNAMSPGLNDDMVDVLNKIEVEEGVGCVVITGAGRGFCSGFDLKAGNIADPKRKSVFRMLDYQNHWVARIRSFAKPTIAGM